MMLPVRFSALPALPILFLLATSFFPAGANDTAFGGSAASPYPVHTKEVRMVSEDITIRSDARTGNWLYTCEFVFENLSEEPVSILMGMPFSAMTADAEEAEFMVTPSGGNKIAPGKPMVWDFTAAVDGKRVAVTAGKPTVNPKIKDLNYMAAYTWPMHFAGRSSSKDRPTSRPGRAPRVHPSQKRKNQAIRRVRNTYTLAPTESAGNIHLDYILKTGGLWHDGRIGHSRLRVIHENTRFLLPPERPKHKPYLSGLPGYIAPAGYKIRSGDGPLVIEWDLRDFAPKEDLEVIFRHRELMIMDHTQTVFSEATDRAQGLRRLRNLPYAAHGYSFKNKTLRDYFATLWYPMHDPSFKESDFSKMSRKLIADAKREEAEMKR